jgi:hypothetical protein
VRLQPFPTIQVSGAWAEKLFHQTCIDSTMVRLQPFPTIQAPRGIGVFVDQGHFQKPSHGDRWHNVFTVGEGRQGFEFFVRKPDRKFSSFHGLCI